jgi:hypothetical protein
LLLKTQTQPAGLLAFRERERLAGRGFRRLVGNDAAAPVAVVKNYGAYGLGATAVDLRPEVEGIAVGCRVDPSSPDFDLHPRDRVGNDPLDFQSPLIS